MHNPTGSGIAAFSTSSSSKQQQEKQPHSPSAHHGKRSEETHATAKIEEGSSRRNITRKKTDAELSGKYDSRNKKHGGAGKGRWLNGSSDHGGIITSVGNSASAAASNLLAEEDVLDVNDPLYISEIDSDPNSYILSSSNTADAARLAGAKPDAFDTNHQRPIYGPLLTLSEFKLRLDDILREYFDSSDAHEVIRSISELGCTLYHPHILVRAIGLGMDAGPRERELISRLLSCLHPTPLSDGEMEAGYEMALDRVDDWMIDIPDAKVREIQDDGSKTCERCIVLAFCFSCSHYNDSVRLHITSFLDNAWFLPRQGCHRRSPTARLLIQSQQYTSGR